MKKMQTIILSLIALALLVGHGIVQDANAGVRVKATLGTPNVRIRVSNTSSNHYGLYPRRHLPIRIYKHHMITKQDRTIARRLSRYTGVPSRALIQFRSQGYRWAEIGRWLQLPRPVVRAAMHQRSWNRFLREERQFAKRRAQPREMHGVAYSDDHNRDFYDD